MANHRKLGKRTDIRLGIINSQASQLIWHGKIETTVDRAKEVRKVAEKMVTLAVRNYKDTVTAVKMKKNQKDELIPVDFTNDGPKKLAARRKMMSVLADLQEIKAEKESKANFRKRTRDINHPIIEKLFGEYAPKYDKREQSLGQGGGYTRIIKLGQRVGDGAQICVLEFVD